MRDIIVDALRAVLIFWLWAIMVLMFMVGLCVAMVSIGILINGFPSPESPAPQWYGFIGLVFDVLWISGAVVLARILPGPFDA